MAEIQTSNSNKNGKQRAKKQSTRVDMTPMVDLAFLLLTFFVLTATFSKPKSMELTFPTPDGDSSPLRNGITFLLSKEGRIFYYEGELRPETLDNKPKTELKELSFSQSDNQSLHKFLLTKNKNMQNKIRTLTEKHNKNQLSDTAFKRLVREAKSNKEAITYLIKADNDASYGNVIDVIDELNINVIGKYVVVEPMKKELELLNESMALK